jgi:hypothetical protein
VGWDDYALRLSLLGMLFSDREETRLYGIYFIFWWIGGMMYEVSQSKRHIRYN